MFTLEGARPVSLPAGHPPLLIVVVDTEEEFDWSRPLSRANVATTSVPAQEIAHIEVFEAFGVRPAYVVDYPVATDPAATGALRRLMEAGACEIGCHLHPWVNPPFDEVVSRFTSYAGNLPLRLERAKLDRLTRAIEDAFGRRPVAYKAGRYGVGRNTFAILAELGYLIDLSVVPRHSFAADGGPDFSGSDARASLVGGVLELPLSAGYGGLLARFGPTLHPLALKLLPLPGVLARTRLLERGRLTPEGLSLAEMVRVATALHRQGTGVFSLAYHSPSLVPGHTPYVRTPGELKDFLARLRGFLAFFRDRLGGVFATPSQAYGLLTGRPAAVPVTVRLE
jgi:hypothetical protein